jgi:hypothetical protein
MQGEEREGLKMGRKKIMLDDLKGWARKQVEQKLALQRSGSLPNAGDAQAHASKTEGKKAAIRVKRREPNKTELEYNRLYLRGAGKFEAVALRLPGGSRYTPDWQSVAADGRVTFHEVKGSYKFHSQSGAAMRFRECVAAFPEFDFIWAVRNEDGTWSVQETRGGQHAVS